MVAFFDALKSAVKSTYCTLASPAGAALKLGGNIYNGLGAEDQGDDLIAAGELLQNASNIACSIPPGTVTGSDFPVPFTGGQCDGVIYFVETQDIRDGSPNGAPNTVGNAGPVSKNVFFRPDGRKQVEILSGNGSSFRTIVAATPQQDVDIQVLSITRLDGQPDDCGDLPREKPQYNRNDWTTTTPVNYDDNNNNPQTDNTTFEFGPVNISPNGLVNVPVSITFENGSSLFGDFNLTTGDINFGVNVGGGGGTDGGPSELPPGEMLEETLSVIVGARIITAVNPAINTATIIDRNGPDPDLYVPDLGTIAFKYQTGVGRSTWGRPIRVKGTDMVIWAERDAIDVAGTPRDPQSFTVIPIIEARSQ